MNAHFSLRRGYAYRSGYDFLLEHGRAWRAAAWRNQYEQGLLKMCYGNAIVLGALEGLRYVEGMALAPTGDLIPHAWNVNAEDGVIDCTWCNRALIYFGCEFSIERADDATWNGDASILDDWKRRWPIFRERWAGEDYTIQWPPSDRLETLRKGRGNPMPASVLEWEAENGIRTR